MSPLEGTLEEGAAVWPQHERKTQGLSSWLVCWVVSMNQGLVIIISESATIQAMNEDLAFKGGCIHIND